MTKIIVCLASFMILHGCHYPCVKNRINPVFIGFTVADVDTIILKAYRPNDNYQHLVDSFMVHNLYASIYTTTHDSTTVFVNSSNPDHWVSAGFDWKIFIPAKNKTVSISNIVSPQTETSYKGCENPVNSYMLDGQLVIPIPVNTGTFYTSGYMVYIHQ
jgi:hypothetical protein